MEQSSVQTYNSEGLLKVVDGCGVNQYLWFFGAFATDLEFSLTVRKPRNRPGRVFTNPAKNPARSIRQTKLLRCN